jgi:hypothetical protein
MTPGLSEGRIVVLISANIEWQVICTMFADVELQMCHLAV